MSLTQVFNAFYSLDSLKDTFSRFIRFNTSAGIDKMTYNRFNEQKDLQFSIIKNKVTAGKYCFTPYKEVLIIKSKDSLPRVISIPTIRDKIVLKVLQLFLKDVFNIEQNLPQKYIKELKENLSNYDYFIKLDISNFYGSIKHGILLEKLKKKIKQKQIISLIQNAITTPNLSAGTNKEFVFEGVPQGLPISNALAHIYLNDLDEKYTQIPHIIYLRYIDDVIILCKQTYAKTIEKQIKYDLEGILNLKLNEKKENKGKLDEGFDYLGYSIKKLDNGITGLTLKDTTKEKFENSIVKLFTEYKYKSNVISPKQFIFRLNNKITGSISRKIDGDDTVEHKYGWLFYYSQIDDTGILYHLDWFVERLLINFNFMNKINRNDIKSFVKAYYEIRYNIRETNYIHKPDILNSSEKKQLLMDVFSIRNDYLLNEANIEKQYYKWIYKPIKEYEKDVHKIKSL